MGAAAYIGRIGGLAVALGVGAAVATGQGVAWADDGSNSGSTSSERSDSSASSRDDSESKRGTQAGNESADSRDDAESDADGSDDDDDDDDDDADVADDEDAVDEDADEDAVDEDVDDTVVEDDEPAPEVVVEDDVTEPIDDAVEPPTDVEIVNPPTDSEVVEPVDDEPVVEDATQTETTDNRSDRREPEAVNEAPEVEKDDVTPVASGLRTTLLRVVDTEEPQVLVDTPVEEPAEILASESDSGQTFAAFSTAETQDVAPQPAPTVRTFVRGLLAKIGFGAQSGEAPELPAANPALWAVLAWTRREFERGMSDGLARTATPVATATTGDVAAPTVAVAPNAITYIPDLRGYTEVRGWVTGPATDQYDPLNHTIGNFDIYGTDLGIMWDNGLSGAQNQVLIAFGDTFSQPGMTGNWRSNVLFRSSDTLLDNGLFVAPGSTTDIFSGSPLSGPGNSKQLVYGIPGTIGLLGIPSFFGSEVTMIPTAGVSVPYDNDLGSRQYMNVMSVRQWGPAGMWTTNYSAIAYSDDNGQNWTLDEDTIRSAGYLRTWGHPYVQGNDNFQQGAFVRGVEVDANGAAVRDANGDVVHDGYVYSYGTPSGRFGSAYLSRVPEDDILELDSYEYWNGSGWSDSPGDAVPVIPSDPSPFSPIISFANNIIGLFGIPATIPNGDVSEISVQYNEYLDEYIILYTNGSGQVVMRTANTPEEAWSEATVLADSTRFPGLYAPMIHPWSGTDKIDDDPQYLYWNLSQWNQYNVEFMKTDLSPMKTVVV